MKLTELAAPNLTKQLTQVFESYFGKRVPFATVTSTQARSMLQRVRGLLREHRAQPAFHVSERNPAYLKLIMLEQGLTSKLREDVAPTAQQVKQGIGIARDKRYAGGNMTGAVSAMRKLHPDLPDHPAVKAELQKQNAEYDILDEANKLNKQPTAQQVKQGIGIARHPRYAGGNMTGAAKEMRKIHPDLPDHPAVKAEIQKHMWPRFWNEGISPLTGRASKNYGMSDSLIDSVRNILNGEEQIDEASVAPVAGVAPAVNPANIAMQLAAKKKAATDQAAAIAKQIQELTKQKADILSAANSPMEGSRRHKLYNMLRESEIQQAQVVLASQDMVDRVQKMLEDVSSMQFKDLPALVDQIKNEVGVDQSAQFNNDATAALSGLMQNLQGSKQQLEAALGVVTGQASTMPGAPDQLGADAGMMPPDDTMAMPDDTLAQPDETDMMPDEVAPPAALGRARR